MEFVETTALPTPKPSQFEEPVKRIAGQTVTVGGTDVPKALEFVVGPEVGGDELDLMLVEIASMGDRCEPPVRVKIETEDMPSDDVSGGVSTRIKFWTLPKRTRKSAVGTEPTAS